MKKLWMATTVALVTLTIALLTMAYKPGANEPKQILTVKVAQNMTQSTSGIFIAYPDGTIEVIDIPAVSGRISNLLQETSKKTVTILNKISSQGYTLISSGGGNAQNSFFEIYVFEK